MSHARRALAALAFGSCIAAHAVPAGADAISDQKKAYAAAGIKVPLAATCTIFSKADAERALHAPVVHVTTAYDPSGCSYGLASNRSVGVTVTRQAHDEWFPPTSQTMGVSRIRHVTGVGEDAYTYYMNAGGGGVYTADVRTARGSTSVSLTESAGNADKALAIARSVMNR